MAAGVLVQNRRRPASQSHLLSAGVAVGCRSVNAGGGRGLLDGGEADVGGAVQVADLALGAGTSTASQLTEAEEEEEFSF